MRANIVNRNEGQVEKRIPWVTGKSLFSLWRKRKKKKNLSFQVWGVFREEGISDVELLARNLQKKFKGCIT